MSSLEAITNAVCGLAISWVFTFYGLPIFGIEPDAIQATWITASYFFLSAGRSYAVRRLFNKGAARSVIEPHGALATAQGLPEKPVQIVTTVQWSI